MQFYEKYDMEKILNDLQKKLRIMDWDINFEIINGVKMKDLGEECTCFGLCEKWRRLKEANVYLNGDVLGEDEFLQTFLHELVHIVTDDLCRAAGDVIELIKDNEAYYDMQQDHVNTEYERMVNELAKSFEVCLGEDYLEQFLKEDTDGKGKESLRCKGSKNTLH